jgi:hypothetical protein
MSPQVFAYLRLEVVRIISRMVRSHVHLSMHICCLLTLAVMATTSMSNLTKQHYAQRNSGEPKHLSHSSRYSCLIFILFYIYST